MSFAKYFEDDLEIYEERLALQKQEDRHPPVYRTAQRYSKICDASAKVCGANSKECKKEK